MDEIKNMSYDEALAEAEKIIARLENEKLPIDTILSESRKVTALIAHCREKIKSAGQEVDKILSELREESDRDDTPVAGDLI